MHSKKDRIAGQKYLVPSINRAIAILTILADTEGGLSLSEVAEKLNVPKSSIFNLLNTLLIHNFVNRDQSTNKYSLGMELFHLGSFVVEQMDIRRIAAPMMHQLVQKTGLTTNLGVMDRGEIVYIDKIECPGPIKIRTRVGSRMGVHCTALGKAILAFLPGDERLQVLKEIPLQKKTTNTLVVKEQLLTELELTRERGYALDFEENELNVRCLASPVLNHEGRVVCAISISGVMAQVDQESIPQLVEPLLLAAHALSAKLGYKPTGKPIDPLDYSDS